MKSWTWLSAFIPTALAQNLGAQKAIEGVNIAAESGYGTKTAPALPTIIGGLINGVLGLLGLAFLILLIYAGIQYLTARGDVDKTKQAKSTIINAVIGLIIIVAAFAISTFIFSTLETALSTGINKDGVPLPPAEPE